MNDLIIPQSILTKIELQLRAKLIVDYLMQFHTPAETWVIGKQLEALSKEMLSDALADRVINCLSEKKSLVLGATVEQKRSIDYEYRSSLLDSLSEQSKALSERIKNHKKEMQLAAERGGVVVDDNTGEEYKAIKIKDGTTIAVTFPK